MDRQPPYTPPSEPTHALPRPLRNVPPAGFVDYWDWSKIRDNRAGVRTGRLERWLRDAARTRNPQEILRRAVVAAFRPTTAKPGAESNALADLAVTGRASFAAFMARPLGEEDVLRVVRSALPGTGLERIRRTVRSVLDRTYSTAWALRGSPSQRRALRPSLGWIAVSGEDDPPHAPTNVPASQEHMGEITLRVGRLPQPVTLRATLMLPRAPTANPLPNIQGRLLPRETALADALADRKAAEYDELFLFVHGLGSRAEESERFKRKLVQLGAARDRRYAVLSVDMPGMGYSSRLDLDTVLARAIRTGPHGFALPQGRGSNFPLLGLYRDTLVELCNSIRGGVQYVMGGSLGGNMTLWLAAEPMFTTLASARQRPSTVTCFLSWSPASIWESYERSRDTFLEGNGTHMDVGKNGAKKSTKARMHEPEDEGRRWEFFEKMQRGESIVGLHILGAWGYPPTPAGLLLQSELYGKEYRRVFWGVSYEQVTFSHQEPLTPSGQWPFRTIRKPLFLASGGDDVGEHGVMDIYNQVVAVTDQSPSVPGRRYLMRKTPHSISDVRPNHLAGLILNFLCETVPTKRRTSGGKAWAWASRPQTNNYTADTGYQYNSSGGANTVRRIGTGQYAVTLPGLTTPGGVAHAVAYGGNHYCKIVGWGSVSGGLGVRVNCFNPRGVPVNGRFNVLFYAESSAHTGANAYLWADKPGAASYRPAAAYQWNSKGLSNAIRRLGVGRYKATLPGLSNPGGHVMVSAYGSGTERCAVKSWVRSGRDMVVEVLCFDVQGSPADSQFTLTFITDVGIGRRSAEDQHYGAYLWADRPATASYTPNRQYQLNTAGGVNGIERTSAGVYRVHLPQLASRNKTAALVTAYGSGGEYCTVQRWASDARNGTNVIVNGFNHAGMPKDTRFTLLYLTDDQLLF